MFGDDDKPHPNYLDDHEFCKAIVPYVRNVGTWRIWDEGFLCTPLGNGKKAEHITEWLDNLYSTFMGVEGYSYPTKAQRELMADFLQSRGDTDV